MAKVNLVVLNAGEASRLRPLTSGTSKCMVRLNGKPVIDHIIESVGAENIRELIVVEGRLRDTRDYLMRRDRGFPLRFCEQTEPLGPRDAIKHALVGEYGNYIGLEGPLVVWFGDTLAYGSLPFGDSFFATHDVVDQSEWLVWDGQMFHDKPREHVTAGRAFVGVLGAESVDVMHQALRNSDGEYDVGGLIAALQGHEVRDVEWYDIGVPSRYYATCAALLNQRTRAFNSFSYDPNLGVLTKHANSPEAVATLEAEALWYKSLRPEQAMLAPRFVGWHANELCIGYEPGILLSDLALYHDLPQGFWDYVIGRVVVLARSYLHNGSYSTINFHQDFAAHTAEMWSGNVVRRLARTEFPPDVCQFLIETCKRVEVASRSVGTMHGDMHLSNILYEPTTGRIVFLDPRGRYGSCVGPSGSDMYDYCKLAYDCYHGFSAIVAGVPQPTSLSFALENALVLNGIDVQLVCDGGIVLLASGIPLHYDSERRQEEMTRRVVDYVRGRLDAKAA